MIREEIDNYIDLVFSNLPKGKDTDRLIEVARDAFLSGMIVLATLLYKTSSRRGWEKLMKELRKMADNHLDERTSL